MAAERAATLDLAPGRRRRGDQRRAGGAGDGGTRDRPLHVCFVTANTFEYDSRTWRAARALAADGHIVTVVALQGPGCRAPRTLDGGIRARPTATRSADPRPPSGRCRRPSEARSPVRSGFDGDAIALPPRRPGWLERVRGPLRRGAEILAYRRRVGPWASAAIAAAPDADVFSAKALVALPVIREAARRTGGRFVYDIADLHVESGRLARLPRPVKSYLSRRERAWMADAAALTTVTEPMADEIARRFGVASSDGRHELSAALATGRARRPTSARLRGAVVDGRRVRTTPRSCCTRVPSARTRGSRNSCPRSGVRALRDDRARDRVHGVRADGSDGCATAAAASDGRIVVLPPVPSDELLEWTAGASLAFVGAPPRTINLGLTIPNKLFESLMAGVPVVVAGRHGRRPTGRGGRCRASSSSRGPKARWPTPWRGRSSASPADRHALRARARRAALDRFNWETERDGLVEVYRGLPSRDGVAPIGDMSPTPLRVVLLLNNAYTADSRSWKLANSLSAAGCRVTVVARAAEGLPIREERDGYRILRVAQPQTLRWLPAPALPRARAGAMTRPPEPGRRNRRTAIVRVARPGPGHGGSRRTGRPVRPAHAGLGGRDRARHSAMSRSTSGSPRA